MKRLCLFLSAFIIVSTTYGQIGFGVKSGMNIATTKGIIEFPKNKVGWYGGGFVIIPVSNKCKLPFYSYHSEV